MSSAVQAFGSLQQGQAGYEAANYNARVAEQNAEVSRQQAAEEARRSRVASRQALGDIRSGYAASGVTLEGSALDVLKQSAANAELDALTISNAGAVKANSFQNTAALERYKGQNALNSGRLSAAGFLLGGVERGISAGAGSGD